jgi:hypothetical protein
MAQMTGAADDAARPLPRSSVRPSWSYEIVTVEEQQDTGRVLESNILDTPRRRKRPRKQKEATDTEMVPDGQSPQTAVAANFMSVDVNAVTVPDAIHGGPSARQLRDIDVVSIMRSKEQETALKGIPRQRAENLPCGINRGQHMQHAFSPLGYLRGPQAGMSPITQAPNYLSYGRNQETARPSAPTADQMQEINSTQEGTLWKNNHVALPQCPRSDDVLPANNTRASHPHDLGHLLNRSAVSPLGSAQAPEPSRWILNNMSISNSALHSDHSTYNARSSKQAIFEGSALKPSKTPTTRYFVLADEPTPSSLDPAVSAISPVVCVIVA